MSIMTIVLYIIASVCSLLGSKYFILNYQNTQMDKIEEFLRGYNLIALLQYCFITLEASIVLAFILQKRPRWYFILAIYAIPLIIAYAMNGLPSIVISMIITIFDILFAILDQLITNKHVSLKVFGKQMLRLLITVAVTFVLQLLIYIIKTGSFSISNHIMNLSATIIYAIEYEIALSVILFTITLYINREKGDSDLWITQHPGGFSQTSKTNSQKSSQRKNLTKIQRNKLRLLYTKVFLIQIFGFLLLMVLPFLLGKVFEFLVMYFAFAVVRAILGFNYSLHYKKESICITVGVIIFGILTLAVPFFTVDVIIALTLGVGLAILLHLSYKYKSMWLFQQVSKPDKFALLYVFFDTDLSEHHVKAICKYKGLDDEQTRLIYHYTQGEKISYLAWKFNYFQRMINYKLDEAIDKLIA